MPVSLPRSIPACSSPVLGRGRVPRPPLTTVEATTVLVPAAATTVPVPADDDAMNIVENAPIPVLGMVACLPTVRRESARLKARRQLS